MKGKEYSIKKDTENILAMINVDNKHDRSNEK